MTTKNKTVKKRSIIPAIWAFLRKIANQTIGKPGDDTGEQEEANPDISSDDVLLILAVREWFYLMHSEQKTVEAVALAVYMAQALDHLIVEINATSVAGKEAQDTWLAEPYNVERFGVKAEHVEGNTLH